MSEDFAIFWFQLVSYTQYVIGLMSFGTVYKHFVKIVPNVGPIHTFRYNDRTSSDPWVHMDNDP